jgi:hypothetical protein
MINAIKTAFTKTDLQNIKSAIESDSAGKARRIERPLNNCVPSLRIQWRNAFADTSCGWCNVFIAQGQRAFYIPKSIRGKSTICHTCAIDHDAQPCIEGASAPVGIAGEPTASEPAPVDMSEILEQLLNGTLGDIEKRLREVEQNGGNGGGLTVTINAPEPITTNVKMAHAMLETVLVEAQDFENVYLKGPAGTGKTFLAKQVAECLSRDFLLVPCSKGLTEGSLDW